MTPEEREKCFEIMCRSKRGEKVTRKESNFCTKMFRKYPDEYKKLGPLVFEATRPFGSKILDKE